MATKTFSITKDSLVALSSGGTSLGAGADNHLPVGVRSGYTIRSLLQATIDNATAWQDVYSITKAELKVQTSPTNVHGIKSADTFYISRNTTSWAEGTAGSGESAWSGSNAVEWSNKPTTTTSGRATVSGTASHDVLRTYDITSIVKAWVPTDTTNNPNGIPGAGGAANYGITLQQTSEVEGNFCEFMSSDSTPAPYILLTYSNTATQTNPTATKISPTASGIATIPNIGSESVDSSVGGSWTPNARFSFTYTDAEQAMSKYQVKVYSDAGGTVQVYDSGEVVLTVNSGTTVTHDTAGWAPANNTTYYWKVQVWDSYSTPGTNTPSLSAFVVRWGNAVISRNVGAGATALAVALTPSSPAANTQRMVMYRLASSSAASPATTTSWVSSPGSLPTPGASTNWLQVYIRLSSNLAGTNPQIDKAVFSYLPSGSASLPDKWTFSANSTLFTLDTSLRRYGSKSLKATSLPSTTSIYPKRGITSDQDIPVTPSTAYVLTAEVRTNALPLTSGSISLVIYSTSGDVIAGGAYGVDSEWETLGTYASDGSTGFPEGWQRLRLAFSTPAAIDRVRPAVLFTYGSSSETFWIDGAMLTEGTVAPPWSQGTVAASGTISASGMVLDGSSGAILRARGKTGGSRDIVELGSSGLVFGGTTSPVEISSPDSSILSAGSSILRQGGGSFPANKTNGDRFWRTDLGMEFQWDGSRWLSTQLFTARLGGTQAASDAATANNLAWSSQDLHGGTDLWLVNAVYLYRVAAGGTALGASHYWTLDIDKAQSAATTLTNISTKVVNSGTSDLNYQSVVAVGALMNGGTSHVGWRVRITKTGTPGALFCGFSITYRVVAT